MNDGRTWVCRDCHTYFELRIGEKANHCPACGNHDDTRATIRRV